MRIVSTDRVAYGVTRSRIVSARRMSLRILEVRSSSLMNGMECKVVCIVICALEVRRMLVVDDSAVTRKLLRTALEKASYTVDIAENGRDALAHMQERYYDMVFMDLQASLVHCCNIALHYIALHSIFYLIFRATWSSWACRSVLSFALRCIVFIPHYVSLCCVILHYMTSHFNASLTSSIVYSCGRDTCFLGPTDTRAPSSRAFASDATAW